MHNFPDIVATFALLVFFNDEGQGINVLNSMRIKCLMDEDVLKGKVLFYLASECIRDDIKFHWTSVFMLFL